MNRRTRGITKLRTSAVAVVGVMSLAVSTAAVAAQDRPEVRGFTASPLQPDDTVTAAVAKAKARGASPLSPAGMKSVIVKLDVQSVASYDGHLSGFAATSPAKTGKKFDPRSPASRRYKAHVDEVQARFAQALRNAAPQARITADYDYVLGGIAVQVPQSRVGALAALPGVVSVLPDQLRQLNTNVSPQFIGAPNLWQQLGGQGSAGEGVVVGVLDTGIWPEHPSYSDPDPLGKPYAAPPPPLSGARQCEFSGGANPGPAFSCNNKLIGADRFMATYDAVIGLLPSEYTTARDDNGHGSHTSSTAAGNRGVAASIFGTPRGTVSGIAPRAHVIMYKVCGDSGCFQSDSVAAVQKAILDGANTLNFSISGGSSPYADAVEQAFLDAYNSGVFVAASAGNSGPEADTVDHRGPWTTTVAASTSNRHFLSDLTLTAGNGDVLTLTGASITAGISTPKPVILATAAGSDALCVTPIPANSLTNEIVVCQRGPGRILKSRNVFVGGGDGMILYNASRLNVFTDNHWVPTVHLENDAEASLLAFLGSHTGVTATFTQSTARTVQGDEMTAFSSRGGSGQTLGVSKPDVTAPGLQILAGNTPTPATVAGGPPGELFQSIAGTSMSSPHVAGSAALVKDRHPSWTPGQIKSALMTTASDNVVNNDGVSPTTPFDRGSGRVMLNKAGNPGATFDVPGGDYVTFKDQLYRANYPSLYIPSMPGLVKVRRTLHSVLTSNATWKLKVKAPADLKVLVPSSLTVPAGGDVEFDITVDATTVANGQVRHAVIELSNGPARKLRFPITIARGQAPVTLDKACAPASIALGNTTTCTLTLTNPTFDDAAVHLTDELPSRLALVAGSATGGATESGNTVSFDGTLAASAPADVAIATGSSPAGGYLPLSLFGVPPVSGVGDETLINFNVPAFSFAGETWTRIGFDSNGYAVVGGGSGPDNQFINQELPDPARPNNVLAPFWTDLNPGAGGAMRIATLTDGADTWIVLDWEAVREFSLPRTNSFQMWIGIDSDANPGEDVSYAYGTIQGNGDGGFMTTGAENRFGNRGQNYYVDGTGTLPSNGTQLRVTTAPGSTTSHVITFGATGVSAGTWRNCAEMTSPAFFGASIQCFSGEVTP